MSESTVPKPRLKRPMASPWFMAKKTWKIYMIRELTCVFVGLFALELLMLAGAVADGPDAYAEFLTCLETPWLIGLNVFALAMVTYHSITWFVAAPKALRLHIGDNPVDPKIIIYSHYALWLVLSIVVFLVLRG